MCIRDRLYVIAAEGQNAEIQMNADDGDDNADYWRFLHVASDNSLRIQNYGSGGWGTSIEANSIGNVELYHNGTKKLETSAGGIKLNGADSNGAQFQLGASNDFAIEHDGTNSYIYNNTNSLLIQCDANVEITAKSGGTKRFRFDSDGLKFGSDTAAANALNDYEEGTFNATYYWSGSDANADGRYTKIGNRVFISVFEFAYSGNGLNDKDITYISGLPFNSRSEPNSVGTIVRYSGGNNQTIAASETCYIAQGGTQIKFDDTFNSGNGNWTLSLVYETDS